MTKAELRSLYLEKRRSLSPGEVADASRRIAERFFNEIDLTAIGNVHTFVRIPKFNEIDTSNIYFRLWQERRDILTFAPRTLNATEMESIAFDADTLFDDNKWGIREPLGNEKADPQEFDLVLVPLLCFDESGHRVGYGKGFYDRFLASCRPDCLKVGLSYFPPEPSFVDIHERDVPIDVCITPERNFRFQLDSKYLN
jgi:5-formyltetrahydrofolate cyclo-ligase